MYLSNISRLLFCLVLIAASGVVAHAQSYGRVVILVTDGAGNAMPDVEVAVHSDKTNYADRKTTNKKGKATFTFTDTAAPFVFTVAVDGYVAVEKSVQVGAAQTVEEEIVLEVARTVGADGGIQATAGDDSGLVLTFNAGVQSLQDGDLDTAKAKFLEVLALDDKMALAHSALAGIYLREKDFQAAVTSVNRYLELAPPDSRAYRTQYEAYKGLGNAGEAEKALRELSKLNEDGDTPAILYNEGLAALQVGDASSAKARFEEAVQAKPDMLPALTALAKLYSDEKNHAKAAEYAERVYAQTPDNINVIRLLYVSYHELGDVENREKAFKLLADADPVAMAKQFFDHGVALFNAGRVEEAAGEFERALELKDDIPQGHYRLGMCYVNLGQQDKAREHLNLFVTATPNDPEAELARNMLKLLK